MASTISVGEGAASRDTDTSSVWPLTTGTRVVPALTVTGWGSTPSAVTRPRIFRGSVSIFDSSPRITGMTLPSRSSEGTPG